MGRPSSTAHDQTDANRRGGAEQHRRRTMTALFLVVLVNVVGFGIVIPLLPFYAQEFGASSLTVGMLFASYAAAQVVAVPVLGYLADRHGRRPVLLLSLTGSLVAFLLLALAQHLAVLFAARIIDGASGGNITTARAAVADVTPEAERAQAYGTLGAAVALGTVVGPALGGVLAGVSFRIPGYAAALLAGGAILLVWFWLPETLPADAKPRGWPWTEGRQLIGRDLAHFLGVDLAYWAAFAAFQTAFPLFIAERLGYGAQGTGLLLGYVGAISAVVRLRLIGTISECFGDRKTLAGGWCSQGWASAARRSLTVCTWC
jgi:DHA1 family tetracycline resistance protein-like MFS transporter